MKPKTKRTVLKKESVLENRVIELEKELEKATHTIGIAAQMGAELERKEWIDMVPKDTAILTIKARSAEDKVDQIRINLTREQFQQDEVALIENVVRDTLYEIATKGEVIKGWLPTPHPKQ